MFKPQITLSLGKTRKKDEVETEEKTVGQYIDTAKNAVIEVGKKVVLGGVVLISSYVLLTTGQQILVHHATKEPQEQD